MENATKALLIAAAILIAILIISLSLVVYRMASETIGNVNLSEAEITQFNAKFTPYDGKVVNPAELEKFCTDVIIPHNQQEEKAGTKNFVIVVASKTPDEPILNYDAFSAQGLLEDKGKKYPNMEIKLTCNYENGLINKIIIKTLSFGN